MSKVLLEIEKHNLIGLASLGDMLKSVGSEYRAMAAKEITNDDLDWCDVYFAIRPVSVYSFEIAKVLKKNGIFYAVFFDDNILSREYPFPARRKYAKACIEIADIVCGSNRYLVDKYAELTSSKRTCCFDMAIDSATLLEPASKEDKLRFVYAAGADHAKEFESLVLPAFAELLPEYHDKLEVTFISVAPNVNTSGYPECFKFVNGMPYAEYNKFMSQNRFDIGFAPLHDTEFGRGKYYNKYVEYAKVGIMGLFSDCIPYSIPVKNGENGILIENTKEAWKTAIDYCLNNPDKVKEMAQSAVDDIKKNFTADHRNQTAEDKFPEMISYQKPAASNPAEYKKCSKLSSIMFELSDKLCLINFSLKSAGFKKTISIVKERLGIK